MAPSAPKWRCRRQHPLSTVSSACSADNPEGTTGVQVPSRPRNRRDDEENKSVLPARPLPARRHRGAVPGDEQGSAFTEGRAFALPRRATVMTVRPSKFVHVAYRSRRFEEMLAWYQTVFGANVQDQVPAIAFLTYDEEHHRFAFVNMDLIDPGGGGSDDRGAIGVDHVAYTYSSLSDLFDSYAELKGKGISPYWCIHHGITVSMHYGDPDGNQMEFQVDCFTKKETRTPTCIAPSRSIRSVSSTTPTSGSLRCGPARRSRTCSTGVPVEQVLARRAGPPLRAPLGGVVLDTARSDREGAIHVGVRVSFLVKQSTWNSIWLPSGSP